MIETYAQPDVKTGQTEDLSNIVRLLQHDRYLPPDLEEIAPHGFIRCPDGEVRHIIGSDTVINNGVYVSYGLHQNIIVDYEHDTALQVCGRHVKTEVAAISKGDAPGGLEALSQKLNHFLPYNEARVANFLQERNHEKDGEFQKLGDFILMDTENGRPVGAGVCLHQALLGGVLLEAAIEKGELQGRVSVMRNHDYKEATAHAWIVYEDQKSTWICDPALQAVHDLSDGEPTTWRYGIRHIS